MTDTGPLSGQNPPQVPPAQRDGTFWGVLSQERVSDDVVEVLFSVPKLGKVRVAVPYETWLTGDYFTLGPKLPGWLDSWDPGTV